MRTAVFVFRFVLLGAFASALLACVKLPEGRSAIDDVTVHGASNVDEDDLKDAIATAPSPKFLGLFRGIVYEYTEYDRGVLEHDIERIERLYRARGYYHARAHAARVVSTGKHHVRVEIVVDEGPPVKNGELVIDGIDQLPENVRSAVILAARAKLIPNAVFEEESFKGAETEARRALTDRGYAFVKISSDANVDVVKNVADVQIHVEPGPTAVFGKITIEEVTAAGKKAEGSEIPEGPLRRAMDLDEGAPFSTASLQNAQQALLDLGVFSSVDIVPQIDDPPPASRAVPIVVHYVPTKLRTVRLGGGVEFDQLKTEVHAVSSWEDHNFLGGLRTFRVQAKPGVVIYPTRISNFVPPDRVLPEGRLAIQFRQPGFIEGRTAAFVRPEANVFPLLLRTGGGEDERVIGYREVKGSAGVERTIWRLFASVGHNVQVENPFAYKGGADPDLRTLVISYPEILTQLDMRNDRIRPHRGIYVGNDMQFAGGPFGGNAIDFKIQPDARVYIPVAKRITFATRGSIGFLYPFSYGDVVRHRLGDPTTAENRSERVRDIETVFFRGFFSGGSTSNRGFPLRGIAPHGVVPFLNPSTASQQVALNCNPSPENNFNPDPTVCSISIGGFSLWELSNELRFAVGGPFSAAIFCDMADVSPHTTDLRFNHLHLACGSGARYDTPVGPIRVDVGYRIQPLQVIGFRSEDAVARSDITEGVQPKLGIGGLQIPIAVSFGLGEAF